MIYKYLTDDRKQIIENTIDNMDIDVSLLDSYGWDSNPYCVENHLIGNSGCCIYDEDEAYDAKVEKLIEFIKSDGWWEYLTFNPLDDEDLESDDVVKTIQEEVLDYLNKRLD